jgi:hypothetical protein
MPYEGGGQSRGNGARVRVGFEGLKAPKSGTQYCRTTSGRRCTHWWRCHWRDSGARAAGEKPCQRHSAAAIRQQFRCSEGECSTRCRWAIHNLLYASIPHVLNYRDKSRAVTGADDRTVQHSGGWRSERGADEDDDVVIVGHFTPEKAEPATSARTQDVRTRDA